MSINTKKALLIGINYINDSSAKLQGCINDVVNIKNMLIDAYDYLPSNIIILRDDSTNPELLPTTKNILARLSTLIANSADCSELWIYYSGHGSQLRDLNGDEISGIDSTIVPVNYKTAGFINDDHLHKIIKNTKCRTILLFDSCHSGTICDLEWVFQYQTNNTYSRTQVKGIPIKNPNIFIISACKDTQTCLDIFNSESKQVSGLFTSSFIHSLRANRHSVELFLLYRDVCNLLTTSGYNNQMPVLSSSAAIPLCKISRT